MKPLGISRLSAPARALACIATGLCCALGCSNQTGTISLEIASTPGSDIMDRVARVRLTLDEPLTVVEATRSPGGSFDLAIDVPASGALSTVTFEGFDEADILVAYGRTLPLPLALVDTDVALFVAPPMSLTQAPVLLEPARARMGVAPLSFGAVLAGGREADGALSGLLDIYNAYIHDFQHGEDLPERRADITSMVGAIEHVYLFGGVDSSDRNTATGWRFATNIPPRGAYNGLSSSAVLARSGARAAPLPGEAFVVTGDPAVLVDGVNGSITPYPGAPALAGTATTVIIDSSFYTLFLGSGNGGVSGYQLTDGAFTEIDTPALARTGHATVILPDATILTVGGEFSDSGILDSDGVVLDVRSLEVRVESNLLFRPRRDAAVAASQEFVVVAGGVDAGGELVENAEIFDAVTLARVATLPMLVPRRNASAVALANGQILILGGLDAAGEPISVMELFTPEP